jgi:hypothetical protein
VSITTGDDDRLRVKKNWLMNVVAPTPSKKMPARTGTE